MKILPSKQDTFYVSDIDRFQKEFDQQRSKSKSQQAEFDKHQRVMKLRDKPVAKKQDESEKQ